MTSVCGSEIANPFCFQTSPSDPSNWWYDSNNTWNQASLWSPLVSYSTGQSVMYNQQIYVCTRSCPSNSGTPVSADANLGWVSASLHPSFVPSQCPANYPASGPTMYKPQPDPNTGTCEKSTLDDPCVNPCIRLPNGKLTVNKNVSQCRVFPNTSSGGTNDSTGASGPTICPTVCPQSCVELWETCPQGTGPLTTLLQTKSPLDLFSLTGALRKDGTPNPLWPANSSATFAGTPFLGTKPYTECYQYNTRFCDLPLAWQETSLLGTFCFSNCPAGTVQDSSSPRNCLFLPIDPSVDPNTSAFTSSTPIQKVFCNPQYFTPLYWTDKPGLQKGCTAIPLESKQGSTCPLSTSAVVNENFTLEWCMPDCPNGYVQDLTQSTCLATCEGLSNDSYYNAFWDYVDFYAMSNRCKTTSTTANGVTYSSESQCIQNKTPGRCPMPQQIPPDSSIYDVGPQGPLSASQHPMDVLIRATSIDTVGPYQSNQRWKQTGIGLTDQEYATFLSKYQSLQSLQSNRPNKQFNTNRPSSQTFGECPTGMVFGSSASAHENQALCYDSCTEGYEPYAYCANGSKTCSSDNVVFGCRALCPNKNEGLGIWKSSTFDDGNQGRLQICTYQYPQGNVPSDPNLWAVCPDDGRYYVLQASSSDLNSTSANRQQPMCVQKTYLRQSSCPNGFNATTNAKTKALRCVQACDSNDVVVTNSNGEVVCQSTTTNHSNRHDLDITCLADSENTKPEHRHRVYRRKNLTRGIGVDPSVGVPGPPDSSAIQNIKTTGLAVGGLLGGVGLFMLLSKVISRR